MKRVLHCILSGILHALARLPMRVLYALADCLYFILCHVMRYRRRVVLDNLAKSFPQMSQAELKHAARKFYRNFADYIVETIKILHISDDEMRQRMVFDNVEIADRLLSQGKSVVAYFSHCFNWEWAMAMTLWSKLEPLEKGEHARPGAAVFGHIYRPLRDKWFDALMLKLRHRFRNVSIPKAQTLRKMLEMRRAGIPAIVGFMSDQKPSHGDPACPTMFLNHPTAMITGTETLGRRLGMAAIYFDMEKLGRGRYKITIRPICEDMSQMPPMAPTLEYARLLEATIRRDPPLWLWSHKRWKHPVTLTQQPAP